MQEALSYEIKKGKLFPTQSAGTKYSSFAAVECRNQQFGFVLIHKQDVLFIGFAERFHEIFASFGQSAEENKSLRCVEGGEVGT